MRYGICTSMQVNVGKEMEKMLFSFLPMAKINIVEYEALSQVLNIARKELQFCNLVYF